MLDQDNISQLLPARRLSTANGCKGNGMKNADGGLSTLCFFIEHPVSSLEYRQRNKLFTRSNYRIVDSV
jgi:hypothetical protein